MNLATRIQSKAHIQKSDTRGSTLKWEKLPPSQLQSYSEQLNELAMALPSSFQHQCGCRCPDDRCRTQIQNEYNCIVRCLKAADAFLPRSRPGLEKDWWTRELTELRNRSIEIQRLWHLEGKPRHGSTYTERLRVRASYKQAIRRAQKAPKQAYWDRLHSSLAAKDTNSFWKSWKQLYNKNKNNLAPVVNGCSATDAIANAFMQSFKSNSTPNSQEKVNTLNDRYQSAYKEYSDKHELNCDCRNYEITIHNTIDALSCLKKGKSQDEDEISSEHLLYAPLSIIQKLTHLFNAMMTHAFVPEQFKRGFMIPIVKDQQGNLSDVGNYRGITISPIISKLFEHILKNVFCEFLVTSPYQYGFKKNSSTVHALHCLRETVNYYVNNNSRVFCSFLDASKAFDRLVHSGLFLKLIQRNVPLIFLDILEAWYTGLKCRVKWNDSFSAWFDITAGVRQGGVLSPDLYSIYVDDLLITLKSLNKGCHFMNLFAAALFYADDMAIMAPSIKGLKQLLDVCSSYCSEWDICLNAKKSRVMYFGRRLDSFADIFLHGNQVQWTDVWSYLGVSLKCGKEFGCTVTERIKKFYRCTNAILRIDGISNEMVMLQLLETHCVPVLSYAIEIVHVTNRDEHRQLRVAYNSLFRKLFEYRQSESVTDLQHFLKRPTWEELVERRQQKFVRRVCTYGHGSLARSFLM